MVRMRNDEFNLARGNVDEMNWTPELLEMETKVEQKIASMTRHIEHIAERNQWKVIQAFQKLRYLS